MIKTKLEAVNVMLRALGEQPISSLSVQYPTLDLVLPALDEQLTGLLTAKWWFNTFTQYRVLPNENGRLVLPEDTLVFYPDDPQYLWTGGSIRDHQGNEVRGTTVTGTRVVYMEFEVLPQMVRYAATYAAAAQVYAADIGVDNIQQQLLQLANGSMREMGSTHTRMRQFTSLRKRQVQMWQQALRS